MILLSKSRPAREAEILVGRTRETIDAAMLAAAIGIHARFKANVGTVIPYNSLSRSVAKELRRAKRSLLGFAADVDYVRVG